MPQQPLNGAQLARFLMDLGHLRAPNPRSASGRKVLLIHVRFAGNLPTADPISLQRQGGHVAQAHTNCDHIVLVGSGRKRTVPYRYLVFSTLSAGPDCVTHRRSNLSAQEGDRFLHPIGFKCGRTHLERNP